MLEQEVASIIKFTLDKAGNPAPYYDEVKKDFIIPSCFFPAPEIKTDGDTLSSFNMQYRWYIKFFHVTTAEAYQLALAVLIALKKARNLVPIIGTDGEETGEFLRLSDPEIKKLDDGVYQLILEWDSRRPYEDPVATLMQDFHITGWLNGSLYREPTAAEEIPQGGNFNG